MVVQSFRTAMPGQAGAWSIDGWRAVFGERALQTALYNTVTLTVARQVLALVIAVFIAWLLARTICPAEISSSSSSGWRFFCPVSP